MKNRDFKINVQTLQKQFLCNICFNQIEDCYITRCGHIYCKNCIYQTINRHHRCPFCNVALNQNDVFKNYHFNTLRKIINKQKETAASMYLSKVLEQQQIIQDQLMKPIQNIIRSSCSEGLLTYRKYVKQLFENMEKNEQIKSKYTNQKMKTTKQLIEQIHKIMIPFLKSPVISPLLIPQQISLSLKLPPPFIKNIILTSSISANTPVGLIFQMFQKSLKQSNIRIQFQNKNQALIVFNDKYNCKLQELVGQNIKYLNQPQNTIQLKNAKIIRNIQCYSYKWFKGKQINYFTCKQCSINWICQTCINYCHEGHNNILQLQDHAPSWACCYCVSKSDCKALNKNNAE